MSDVGLLAVLGVIHLLAICCGAVLIVPLLLADQAPDEDGPGQDGFGGPPGPVSPDPVAPPPGRVGPPLIVSVPGAVRLRGPAPLRHLPSRRQRPGHPARRPAPAVAR
jgi:hypothetical protein